ncbi:hypothetical protein RND71_032921 [Anisodus tanguticus]|uniref:UBC core domain-containing protein n=1 Tax=Anisodus tanguticus TaxID=243964 RepID=A0AAE1UX18_9SOLA|nr:hypothetical protein RND71_032921 [Anisodus tanguticus]
MSFLNSLQQTLSGRQEALTEVLDAMPEAPPQVSDALPEAPQQNLQQHLARDDKERTSPIDEQRIDGTPGIALFFSPFLSASSDAFAQAVRMSTPARKRLMRDFKRLQQDPPAGISGAPYDNNIMLWNAVIFGYGYLDLNEYKLIQDLPRHSKWILAVICISPDSTLHIKKGPDSTLFYADGSICLDILQNQWSPIYDVAAILTSIQSLLCDPNPNSPANSEAARMFSENKREYNRKVREIVEQSWTAD